MPARTWNRSSSPTATPGPFPAFPAAHVLRDLLLAQPTPWLPAGPWLDQWRPTAAEEWAWELPSRLAGFLQRWARKELSVIG